LNQNLYITVPLHHGHRLVHYGVRFCFERGFRRIELNTCECGIIKTFFISISLTLTASILAFSSAFAASEFIDVLHHIHIAIGIAFPGLNGAFVG
jgi:hypothetical protein